MTSIAASASWADVATRTVGSDVFARGVFLSLEGIDNFFSDNYFDILPGEKRKIHVRTSIGSDEMRRQLKILSLGDTF